jgi:branched-chain amino acid transport system substrate-binding protein
MDKLTGKKIANIYLESAYGKETIPVLDEQAKRYGFSVQHFAVASPGLDQKAVWLQIARQLRADWVILRGWGVMNPAALKEAERVGFPREKIVGVWWSGSEEDVVPAGDAAEGYISAAFNGSGTQFPVIQDVIKHVYDKGNGELPRERLGQVFYARAMVWSIISAEAIRDAQAMFGKRPVVGKEVQQALEKFAMTPERIKKAGAEGLIPPFSLSCKDHEGSAAVRFQRWQGGKWVPVGDWVAVDKEMVRPMIEASAAAYAKEKGITPRSC